MRLDKFLSTTLACGFLAFGALPATAQGDAPATTLFTNVHVFHGSSEVLIENANVLVEGNMIKTVSTDAISAGDATIIDGGGRTLMPGLIEGHGHLMMNGNSLADIENNRNWEELASRAVAKADMALMSGFTSWRDMGGMGSGLRKTIDEGLVRGPRIYPAGAFIGPTGSHADFRNFTTPTKLSMEPIRRVHGLD